VKPLYRVVYYTVYTREHLLDGAFPHDTAEYTIHSTMAHF